MDAFVTYLLCAFLYTIAVIFSNASIIYVVSSEEKCFKSNFSYILCMVFQCNLGCLISTLSNTDGDLNRGFILFPKFPLIRSDQFTLAKNKTMPLPFIADFPSRFLCTLILTSFDVKSLFSSLSLPFSCYYIHYLGDVDQFHIMFSVILMKSIGV